MANIWQIYCKVQDSCYGDLMHLMAGIMLLHVPTDHYIIGDLKSVRSTALSPFRSFFQRTRKVLVYFGAFSGAFLASPPTPSSPLSSPSPEVRAKDKASNLQAIFRRLFYWPYGGSRSGGIVTIFWFPAIIIIISLYADPVPTSYFLTCTV